MIWIVIIVLVGYILIKFFISLNNDNYDLENQSLVQKFEVVVNILNKAAFNDEGKIHIFDKRSFNLYKEQSNQIINFNYSTGHLTITWRYKYFQKEVNYEKQFNDVRNLSLFEQEKMGNHMIENMKEVVILHKNKVMSDNY